VGWRRLGTRMDTRIGDMAERVTRRMNRRELVRTAVLGGTASVAAVVLGERPSLAVTCQCGPTRRCTNCPGYGCPSGYQLCKGSFTSTCFNSQGYRCEWPAGEWIACTGLGHGQGIRICYDCKGASGCHGWCTCLSACICCNCKTIGDVRAEQQRMQHALAGAGAAE
jgi:hypothetical protein